jgi:hypothetical protein
MASELPAFRGAVANKVGWQHILFHNHQDTTGKFRYSYPLIQYKRIGRQPAILCLGDGVEEIHKFFEKKSWDLTISQRRLEMKIARLDLQQFTLRVHERAMLYTVRNWIALDQDSYRDYQRLSGLAERTTLLESKLRGNILSLAKGLGWRIEEQVTTRITELGPVRPVVVKGVKVLGFQASFLSNVFLPNYIGLGKNVSLGYGVVMSQRQNNKY